MAFSRTNLYGVQFGARRAWVYDTLDAATVVDTVGYFNAAAGDLTLGDMIFVHVWTTAIGAGGTPGAISLCFVNSLAAGAVDTSDATSLAPVTDTR